MKRKRHESSVTVTEPLPGPSSLASSLNWARDGLDSMPAPAREKIFQACKRGICVGSWYSGWDAPAYALCQVDAEVKLRSAVAEGDVYLGCRHSCANEMDDTCIQLLLSHPKESASEHIFGDFTKQIDSEMANKIEELRLHAEYAYGELLSCGLSQREAKTQVEEELYGEVVVLTMGMPLHTTAY